MGAALSTPRLRRAAAIAVFLFTLLALFLSNAHPLRAESLAVGDVPEPLRPWVDWVLYGQDERDCPFLYQSTRERRCAWPAALELTLNGEGGRFAQTWTVYTPSRVRLPGDNRHWPVDVRLGDKPASVGEQDGNPTLELAPGTHRVEGRFAWPRLPESLPLPPDVGVVTLSLAGEPVARPRISPGGALWLRSEQAAPKRVEDHLSMEVYRRVIDEIPLQVETRLQLDVAGAQREVLVGPSLLSGAIPVRLDSPLPARIEPDGRLRLQLRPGRWTLTLASRLPGPVDALARPGAPAPWPAEEIWSFDARPYLRVVEIEGVPAVDPRQTDLPGEWQSLPAFRVGGEDQLRMHTVRRGEAQSGPEATANRLTLHRQLWLDFDGGGYTVQDRIGGTMSRGWRLETGPRLALGQAVLDGEPQFITRLTEDAPSGVELRRGGVDLVADSRLDGDIRRLPAVGWAEDFQQVSASLHLPPGWDLLTARGVDSASPTWLQRWTLLDLFLVLVAALAVARMAGWGWGALVLVTLVLTWQVPGAPRLVWLNLLAAIALLRVLPAGRLRRAVGWYRNLGLAALVLIALPFMVDEVRTGLYPQLEKPWQGVQPLAVQTAMKRAPVMEADRSLRSDASVGSLENKAIPSSAPPAPQTYLRVDPNARVQTGPGLPDWRWTEVRLAWNGPVEATETLSLVLVPPAGNLFLSLARVVTVAVLALLLAGLIGRRLPGLKETGSAAAVLLVLMLPGLAPQTVQAQVIDGPPGTEAADTPDTALLEELRRRLLAAPDCLPGCAQSPRLRLEAGAQGLTLRQEIHTQAEIGVPLPGQADQWLPDHVSVDGTTAEALYRGADGRLWLALPAGIHQILLRGPLPQGGPVTLPLPLKPKRVEAVTDGWSLQGLDDAGRPDAQLQLIPNRSRDETLPTLEPGNLPPFVRVERTLQLGVDWRVNTRVARLSSGGGAVVLEVPLLPGESVLSEGLRVRDGKVLVNMTGSSLGWDSIIEPVETLTLEAPQTTAWAEYWRLSASPLWHVETAGIPAVHHRDPQGRWLPEWRPWPGESVTLTATRPRGVGGATLTVERSHLELRPGRRSTDAKLQLTLRSSQGGQHSLKLPVGAVLDELHIDGKPQPIRQQGDALIIPLLPRTQEITLGWREPRGNGSLFTTSGVDLGTPSVNATTVLRPGPDRWVLFAGGPALGPAVLFWGVLLVVAALAVGLGRLPLTPLRTWQWLLLGIGLTQTPLWTSLFVVGWLLALGARCRAPRDMHDIRFDLMQTGLAVLSLAALGALVLAVQQGLLGHPQMQIAGNGSSAYNLIWYQDRSAGLLPTAWVLSVPLWVYRLLMLAWALWLAVALLGWLRWGWGCYSRDGLWRKLRRQSGTA